VTGRPIGPFCTIDGEAAAQFKNAGRPPAEKVVADTQRRDGAPAAPTAAHCSCRLVSGSKVRVLARPPLQAGTAFPRFESYRHCRSASSLGFLGFIGGRVRRYYVFLRRALRELDPGRAIPERVKAAFDTLAEGELIMDERGYVLLANNAFVKNIYPHSEPLHGIRVSKLPWAQLGTGEGAPDLSWQTALRNEAPVLGVPMSILDGLRVVHRLVVNATPIVDGKSVVRGVIATFNDVTALHQMNETCRARDLVGRYGGEEFCTPIMGLGDDHVEKIGRTRPAGGREGNGLAAGRRSSHNQHRNSLPHRGCTRNRRPCQTGG
jgi:PAS domain-containing protein